VFDTVNLEVAFHRINDYWSPKIVGAFDGSYVKLVKLKGEFVWHRHPAEDELFLVMRGDFVLRLRDWDVPVRTGELIIVPRGVEHLPVAQAEAHVVVIERKSTVNTGDAGGPRTVEPEWIQTRSLA
jgi:mannose-6-phosphate isomerase-like protein (cupin superfamily)